MFNYKKLSLSDGKITHDAWCRTYIAAEKELCDLMKSLAFTKGPWRDEFK